MSQEVNTLKIKELTEAGETVGEIVSEYIIRKYLKKMQITPTSKKTLITTEIIDNIIKLNTEGLTNKQIGIHLNISPITVRKYLMNNNQNFNSERAQKIITKNIVLTQEQIEVLYGSLLGDMSIGINCKKCI